MDVLFTAAAFSMESDTFCMQISQKDFVMGPKIDFLSRQTMTTPTLTEYQIRQIQLENVCGFLFC